MNLIGHKKQLEYFEKLQVNKSLHHAYLLVGLEHVGKTTLAKHIIANIFQTPLEKLAIHPDFLQVERIDEDGKLKRDITVEHIEAVVSKASRSPIASKQNIILIEDADKMNPYAANSILKTLEEPATPTLFFLLTSNEEKILSTIKSRVHTIQLSSIPSQQLMQDLTANFSDYKNLEEIVSLSHGLPGRAMEWLENTEAFESYKKEVKRFLSLFHKPFFEKLAIIEPLFGDKKAHIEGREELIEILHIWEHCLKILVSGESPFSDLYFPQTPSGAVVPMYDSIDETIVRLGQNIHPRLLMENLLLVVP